MKLRSLSTNCAAHGFVCGKLLQRWQLWSPVNSSVQHANARVSALQSGYCALRLWSTGTVRISLNATKEANAGGQLNQYCKSTICHMQYIFVCWRPPTFYVHEIFVQTLTAMDSLTWYDVFVHMTFSYGSRCVRNILK